MAKYFIPLSHDEPLPIEVKGHRLLILSADKSNLLSSADVIGNDSIREIILDSEEDSQLAQLATEVRGGLVFAPAGIDLEEMIHSLETELPWVH